ncbi:MAG: thiamine phosphate synthase [Duncaniella sp.]|nr:thiamine phosphate synthase [Duncaniella sp.]
MEDKTARLFSPSAPGLIAITPESPVADEGAKITALLKGGFARVHLRHPGALLREVKDIIESVPPEFHSRLVLHGHFDLTHDFNLGGVHLNHRCPTPPVGYHGALSRSCHSLDELPCTDDLAYVTLSPILDSVSKSGYKSRFTPEDLQAIPRLTHTPVIALGGITPERLPELRALPFAGYAMLGAIPWEGKIPDVELFAASTVKVLNIN